MSDNWGVRGDTRAPATVPAQSGAQPEPPERGLTLDGEEVCGFTNEPDGPGVRETVDAAAAAVPSSTPVPATALTGSLTAPLTPPLPAAIAAMVEAPRPITVTVGTIGRAWRALVEAVGDLIDGRDGIWALEAGAGTRPLFDLAEDAFIVGVDRDERALESNIRLDQRIHVELADFRPLAAGFDLITSWYVVDDLADPATVLDRFADWTAPDGVLVLAVPNLRSPRGIAARLTGKARLRRAVTPAALRRRFGQRGFTPVFQLFFEDSDQAGLRRRCHITHGWWKATQALVRVGTLGFLDAARTDYIVVFRRDRVVDRAVGPPAVAP
jgi:SAM-dependent methyltransferase